MQITEQRDNTTIEPRSNTTIEPTALPRSFTWSVKTFKCHVCGKYSTSVHPTDVMYLECPFCGAMTTGIVYGESNADN